MSDVERNEITVVMSDTEQLIWTLPRHNSLILNIDPEGGNHVSYDPSKVYSRVSYEILVMNDENNVLIDWVRMSENGVRLLLRRLCRASEEKIDSTLEGYRDGYFIEVKGMGHRMLIQGKWSR